MLGLLAIVAVVAIILMVATQKKHDNRRGRYLRNKNLLHNNKGEEKEE